MRTGMILAFAALSCGLLTSCKGGYNRPYRAPVDESVSKVAPACTTAPATAQLSQQTSNAYTHIQRLSCNDPELEANEDGFIVGHGLYYGDDQRLRDSGAYGDVISTAGTRVPGLLEFEYQTGYGISPVDVNLDVLDFWQRQPGAMVMITWRPGNPLDPDAGLDAGEDGIDLDELTNGSGAAADNFRSQLNQVRDALAQLRNSNVTVLFNPMPAPNSDDYWWGTENSYTDSQTAASTYIELYKDVREYLLTGTPVLDNTLWLYSPVEGPAGNKPSAIGAPVKWTYPGDAFVDIVSPSVQDDRLTFDAYEEIVKWNKPLGFSAFGPGDISRYSEFSADARFDYEVFSEELRDRYNAAGFFITPYNRYLDADSNDDIEPVVGSTSFYSFENLPETFDDEGMFFNSDLTELNWRIDSPLR